MLELLHPCEVLEHALGVAEGFVDGDPSVFLRVVGRLRDDELLAGDVQVDTDMKPLAVLAVPMGGFDDHVTFHDSIEERFELRSALLHVRGQCW